MNAETKTCQNCKQNFTIEPDDFAFYEKISVPPPTWCPECRFMRRYTFRNQVVLYRVTCDLCKKPTISMHSGEQPFPVYCQKCWWSDKWDPLQYGRDYDFSQPFFKQLQDLSDIVPHLALSNENAVRSEFCNYAKDNKDCYLCFSIASSENSFYCGPQVIKNKDCVSCSMSNDNELCYNTVDCARSYRLIFSRNCRECTNSAFLFDCRNCQDCIGCTNLRNKQYYILNRAYSKEDFERKKKELQLNDYNNLQQFEKTFLDLLRRSIHRYATIEKSTNVTGDNITNSKNCKNCFVTLNSEDSKYSFIVNATNSSYDISNCWPAIELSCDVMSPIGTSYARFSANILSTSLDVYYSIMSASVSHVFGCVGLKQKEYCVLNKQYGKEKYEKLVPRIIEHMNAMPYVDKKGRIYKYGEFFPSELSPFTYNESTAMDYFPLTKEEVLAAGFRWKEAAQRDQRPTVKSADIPAEIHEISDTIVNEVIECAHRSECNENCTAVFRVVPGELALYRILSVPLPRLCPNCRHYARLRQRNPLKLWHRRCMCAGKTSEVKGQMPAPHRREASGAGSDVRYENTVSHFHGEGKCPNEFQTNYSPERKEIVYCEQCYNAEVA